MSKKMEPKSTTLLEIGSKDFYDSIWQNEWFDMERFNPTARHLEHIIVKMLHPLKDVSSLLDVGCGMGVNVKILKRHFPLLKITGTDISPKSLELAQSYVGVSPLIDYKVLNVQAEALKTQYDVVLCSQVLEHIEDDKQAVQNLFKMTGKYLLLTVPGGKFNSTSKLVGHFRHYNKNQLVELVESAGFKVELAYEWGFPFHSIYKFLLDQLPVESQQSIGLGKYGFFKKLISHALFMLFYLNQFDRGANVILLATK